jgi:hypothetical protein
MRPILSSLLVGAAVGLCVPALAEETPARAALSPLAPRGLITEEATAEHAIAFRPFVPDQLPLQVALLPPFHGPGVSANEGIAYAYGRRGRTWILSEWPCHGGTLDRFAHFPAVNDPHCGDVHAIGGQCAAPRCRVVDSARNRPHAHPGRKCRPAHYPHGVAAPRSTWRVPVSYEGFSSC